MDGKKVALVVGASRGIGRQIAIDLAQNQYADPNSPQSTISTVAREIAEGGGEAVAIPVDVRHHQSVQNLIDKVIETYGRLDVVVYNSGAIWWASVEDTTMKRFRLMQQVNPEGLYVTVQATLPHLKRNGQGRIIVVSPPIYSRFFRGKTAYAVGKVGMSVLTKGLAMDFERQGQKDMAITSIWPSVAIESAATRKITEKDPEEARHLRKATIFSDAILAMLRAPAASVNGRLELDEDYLRSEAGVTDFNKYSVVPGSSPRRIMPAALPDLTVAEQIDDGMRINNATDNGSKL